MEEPNMLNISEIQVSLKTVWDWCFFILPMLISAAVTYGKFMTQASRIAALEQSVSSHTNDINGMKSDFSAVRENLRALEGSTSRIETKLDQLLLERK